jgi:shikimate kinase
VTAPPTRPRVVLVGPMGAGKSTVGALLADGWGCSLRDTDDDIERAEGRTVQDIFVEDGEPAFRALEEAAVAAALAEHDGVVALGGGAPMAPTTRERLAGHTVVYLRVGLTDAVDRVGIGTTRPLLNQAVGGLRARIKQLLDERGAVYEQVATHVVDTDRRPPEEVAAEVRGHLEEDR